MFGTSLNSMVVLVALTFSVMVPSSTPQMETASHVETVVSYELPTDANGNHITVSSQGGADL